MDSPTYYHASSIDLGDTVPFTEGGFCQRLRGQAPRLVGGLTTSYLTEFGITLYRVSGIHGSTTPTCGLVDWQPMAGNACGCHPLLINMQSNYLKVGHSDECRLPPRVLTSGYPFRILMNPQRGVV